MEIALALKLGKVVIPILVNDVPPLQEKDLPPVLRQLWKCNALPLANQRFEGDVVKIAKTIGNHLGWSEADVARALLHGSQLHQGKPLEIWLTKWDFIKTGTNRNDFIEFLNSNPPQDLAQLAAKSLERLDWQFVRANPNIQNLEWFLQQQPDGRYAPDARRELQRLRNDARQRAESQAQEKRDAEHTLRAKQARQQRLGSTTKIFISYRRQDTKQIAGRICERLEAKFGAGNVFIDEDSIPFGVDFHDYLSEQVGCAEVVLVLIGHGWADARDESGNRRIDNPDDFVRIEIEAAIQRGIPLGAVLIDGAPMPRPEQLPQSLRPLCRRNAAPVDSVRFFNVQMDRLIADLQKYLA